MIQSPFLIEQDFLSKKQCDLLNQTHSIKVPNVVDNAPEPLSTVLLSQDRLLLKDKISSLSTNIENKYASKIDKIFIPSFEQFFENSKQYAQRDTCDGYRYTRKKWAKISDFDLTGIIWLKDFNSSVPFDIRTDVYGGKLEFVNFNFNILPEIGTLILFPSRPNFLSNTTHIFAGNLSQIRFHIKLMDGWDYNPEMFKGTLSDWF